MATILEGHKTHEAAEIFPLDETNIESLANDIKENGQLMPVELLDGKIIDGRRRYRACQIAGVKAETVSVRASDPVAYVMSLNLHRRHLDVSQKAMVAARAREIYERQAKERQRGGPGGKLLKENLPEAKQQARDAAGEAVGVSGKTVDHATKVLEHGSAALIKAVDSGEVAVSKAASIAVSLPKSEQIAAIESQSEKKELPERYMATGIQRAQEAIACLKKITKSDKFRARAFKLVISWIKDNK